MYKRQDKKIPIIDEVAMIEKVPLGMTCAIEVAQQGSILSTLSNPYGIATVFHLNSEETKRVVPIARSLIGARSGVVIKTPTGDVKERSIKAGTINIIGLKMCIRDSHYASSIFERLAVRAGRSGR